uniref:proline-rich protein 5-like isoform X1 n=1 Tax=Doryrhamphus excisus TaxID=161450 RepID=UPI0025ADAE70|nr:proline-rich protein 5-like isoform X1 [Doryrhamphus excisus]XP_057932411.1 proline-rich protein 5-like isoform X1 [Doryrhamphus excisus]XP_057932412.1 proline-rich protein 5-like isoform X1 [Doryrhamphus excisus]
MGSFRRSRPRFMSSPVLSDLARFHASSTAPHVANSSVWNSVQSAVMKVFQGGTLQANELYTLNESIRWLLKTEMGSFIADYFQNQLLTGGLADVLDRIFISGEECDVNRFVAMVTPCYLLAGGKEQLVVLAEAWDRFFMETLPTLQAIFYPVQGQELSVRQMALLAFRDLVLLRLHLEDILASATSVPSSVTHMLLVLQGIHDSGGISERYQQLEHLVAMVVSPYLSNVLARERQPSECRHLRWLLGDGLQPDVTQPSMCECASLAPLVEQEGEAYLEKSGGMRRHTVANIHADVRLLSSRMHHGTEANCPDVVTVAFSDKAVKARRFSSQPDMN